MPKLNDTQLVILAAAAQHDDGQALPPPKSLKTKGAALTKTLDGLLDMGFLEEQSATDKSTSWRTDEDGRPMTLAISTSGLKALDGEQTEPSEKRARPPKTDKKQNRTRSKTKKLATAAKPTPILQTARPGTKQALLINLLERKNGAAINEIVEATKWQPHSVRGAISGTLKKKLGLRVTSQQVDGRGRVYRIVETG